MTKCAQCGCKIRADSQTGLCLQHHNDKRALDRIALDDRIEAAGRTGMRQVDIARAMKVSGARVSLVLSSKVYVMPTHRMANLLTLAAAHAGLTVEDIRGKSRERHIIHARQAVCLLGTEAGHSSTFVSKVLDRDHSTILHGRDAARERAKRSPDYAVYLDLVRSGEMPAEDLGPLESTDPMLDEAPPPSKLSPAPVPLPAALVARFVRAPRAATTKRRNNFDDVCEDERESELIRNDMIAGSRALADAINAMRAA
jgi:hypothetical protein